MKARHVISSAALFFSVSAFAESAAQKQLSCKGFIDGTSNFDALQIQVTLDDEQPRAEISRLDYMYRVGLEPKKSSLGMMSCNYLFKKSGVECFQEMNVAGSGANVTKLPHLSFKYRFKDESLCLWETSLFAPHGCLKMRCE